MNKKHKTHKPKRRQSEELDSRPRLRPSGAGPRGNDDESKANLIPWLALAWMGFVAIKYGLANFPSLAPLKDIHYDPLFPSFTALMRHLKSLFLWVVSFCACISLGSFFLEKLNLNNLNKLARMVLSAALGYVFLAYTIFTMGVLQLYRTDIFWILWSALLIFFIIRWKTVSSIISNAFGETYHNFRSCPLWITLPLLLILSLAFAMAFVPDLFYDTHVAYLALPKFYFLEGGFTKSFVQYTTWPMFMQMLYLPGLAFGLEPMSKLFHWSAGCLLMCGISAWGQDEKKPAGGILAAMLFLTIPMVWMNWWTGGVDMGVCLYVFLGVWCWSKTLRSEEPYWQWLLLTGIFSGCAFASKYTGGIAPAVIILCHFFVRAYQDKNFGKAVKECSCLAAVSLAVFLPWLIKNAVLNGNPVYPFLASLLGGDGYDPVKMAIFMSENGIWTSSEGLKRFLLPWTWTFSDFNSISFPGPMPLALLPAALAFQTFPKHLRWASLFSVITMTFMMFSNSRSRYAMPFGAPLAFVLGFAWIHFAQSSGKLFRTIAAAFILFMAALNITVAILTLHLTYRPWTVLSGRETPDEYLSYTHPSYPYPSKSLYDFAKQTIPPGSRLLMLGDEKTLTASTRIIWASLYDSQIPVRWSRDAVDTSELYKRFQKEGVTHIGLNVSEARRTMGYKAYDWPDESIALFCNFWDKHVRLVKAMQIPEKLIPEKGHLLFYEILPEEKAQTLSVPFNPILWLYEQEKTGLRGQEVASLDKPSLDKKLRLYENLRQKFPDVPVFEVYLKEFKRIAEQK